MPRDIGLDQISRNHLLSVTVFTASTQFLVNLFEALVHLPVAATLILKALLKLRKPLSKILRKVARKVFSIKTQSVWM